MLTLCPQCRAPSNVRERSCWVCKREFDGSEPKIGDVPFAKKPHTYAERVSPSWFAAERNEPGGDWWEDLDGQQASSAGRR